METTKKTPLLQRFLSRTAKIEPNELKATAVSFLFVFVLMAAYYILRPVRDAMASDWSDAEVSFLWTLNFFISTIIVALYGIAVARINFKRLVPSIYSFFALTFVVFYVLASASQETTLVNKSFYVWVSVFALFHVSVFWSFMADLFRQEQAKRLFAIIASGASGGALLGPAIPTLFAGMMETETLMLVAAALLLLPIPMIWYLGRLKYTELDNAHVKADLSAARIGGNPLAGFKLFATNPYLLGIAAFILLYTMIGSFIYFEQKNLLADYDRATRTQILGSIDWIVNFLTFGLAFFATSRIVERLGVGVALALLPILVVGGLVVLAFAPVIMVLLALQVGRRAGNYGVTKPAREMLFTLVDRETRFKAKPVIDIVVYRGGDTVTSWLFTGLTQGLGLGVSAVALVGAGIAAIWAAIGLYLGRRFNQLAGRVDGISDAENA